jgi:hypothetical protein
MNIYPENKKEEPKYFFRILPRERIKEFGSEGYYNSDYDYLATIVDSKGETVQGGLLFVIDKGRIKTFGEVKANLAKAAGIELHSDDGSICIDRRFK